MKDQIDRLWRAIKRIEGRLTTSVGVPPSAHGSNHSDGGSDPIDITDLDGFPGGSPITYLDSNGEFTSPSDSGGIDELTGDVTAGPGSGSQAATIANGAVTNAKAADMVQATIKGRAAGAGTGDPTDLTPDQASTILDAATDPFVRTSAVGAAEIEAHGITVDGGGSVVTTGVKGRWRCPFNYEIVRWTLLADQAGDVEFDIKVDAFGGSPASIVASAPPELSGTDEDDDATLSGWTTTGSAGDEFVWEVTGTPDAIERVTLVLDLERT